MDMPLLGKKFTWMSMQYSPSLILYICSSNLSTRSLLPGSPTLALWLLSLMSTPFSLSLASASSFISAAGHNSLSHRLSFPVHAHRQAWHDTMQAALVEHPS